MNFNPGTAKAPVCGYIRNVDVETVLRNQTFALQRADQNVYVPTKDSELYNVRIISKPSEQPHPLLFTKNEFNNNIHNENDKIGKDYFYNHTRTQLRNL